MRRWLLVLLGLLCSYAAVAVENPIVRLATTTSTENSGLLDYLLPIFEQHTGYQVRVIAVGTGKALRLGERGDVDVVMVHAPPAEKEFVRRGFGVKRWPIMYNDFVLIGPTDDPAGVRHTAKVSEALATIARKQAGFVSRGDDSGTHKKELQLWILSKVQPEGEWYVEVGQGMGKTLQITDELNAYTMIDRGTWLALGETTALQLLFEGDPPLHNPYAIVELNQHRFPDNNHPGAKAFIAWMTSAKGQQHVASFRRFGQRLFTPLLSTQ